MAHVVSECGKLAQTEYKGRGPIYLPNGFPGNFLKMVNFEMSRRYRESNFNPICTCTECYLYSSITQNGGAIIPQITLKAAKHSAF